MFIINPVNLIGALETGTIVLISVLAGIFVLTFVTSLVRYLKNRKKRAEESTREVEEVTVKKGIRYTDDITVVNKEGDLNISFDKNDCYLKQNVTYVTDTKTKLKPGKYTVLSTREGEDSFNIRIGQYVKEYKHNQSIVLGNEEEITAVSTDIILR